MSEVPDWRNIVELCRRAATDIAFAEIVRAESKRTVLVGADDVDRIRWHVDQAGLGDVINVQESPFIAPGWAYVVDEQAIDAGTREAIAQFRFSFHADPPQSRL